MLSDIGWEDIAKIFESRLEIPDLFSFYFWNGTLCVATVFDSKNEMEIIMELRNGCSDFYEISHGHTRGVG